MDIIAYHSQQTILTLTKLDGGGVMDECDKTEGYLILTACIKK